MRVNFGKYDIPPTLRKLTELWEELKDAERFCQGLHFYLTLGHFRYPCTPCDAVVFGNIGVDGIHYDARSAVLASMSRMGLADEVKRLSVKI